MSFLSIVKKVGQEILHVGQEAEPFVDVLNPTAGAVVGTVINFVTQAESIFTKEKAGKDKKQFVLDAVSASLPLLNAGLQAAGKSFTITPDFVTELGNLIDQVVAVMNGLSKLTGSIK